MKRKLDLEKVEAALKKAGRDALGGPKELRAGRFVGRNTTSGQFLPKTGKRNAKPAIVKP
jgi:hypothetical protein